MKRAVMAFALVTVLCACSRKGDALTIPTGSRVRVEQTNGVAVEGRLVDVSADRIVVEREGGERTTVVRRDIKEIRTAPVSSAAESSALPNPASAAASATMDVTIPAGTVLSVDLETSVGSDTSRVDQPVRGVLRHPLHLRGMNVLPTGTAVFGHVTTAQRPGKVKGRGVIAMRFTEIDTPGAGRTRISTQTVSRMAPASTKKDTLQILGPAAGAALIGGVIGGGKGATEGALIGGGAGTAYVLSTRGKDIRLGKGADISVKLTAPATVTVRREG